MEMKKPMLEVGRKYMAQEWPLINGIHTERYLGVIEFMWETVYPFHFFVLEDGKNYLSMDNRYITERDDGVLTYKGNALPVEKIRKERARRTIDGQLTEQSKYLTGILTELGERL